MNNLTADPVKHTDPSLSHVPDIAWQILGELQLPTRSNADVSIDAWLTEILSPLQLHSGFMDRILKSAQDATARFIQAEPTKAFEHIHLLVFVPRHNDVRGNTWGFFRIEKAETQTAKKNPGDHSIEFYLYLEG